MLVTTRVFASLEIVITEGIDGARPIAVVPFAYTGTSQLPEDIAHIISEDLLRSGKFSPISPVRFPQQPTQDGEVDYAAWASEGVENIVVGKIEEVGIGRFKVSYQLIDVVRGQITGGQSQMLSNGQLVKTSDHVLDGSSVEISSNQFRRYAHRILSLIHI